MATQSEFVYEWHRGDRKITFSWVGNVEHEPSRVYAFAFTDQGKLLLVGGAKSNSRYWLPGGGIEKGEAPEEALARELAEEAAATIKAAKRIGAQRVEDPSKGTEFHTFYWCRIELSDEFKPEHEIECRRLVDPDIFLDVLFWGRTDPKGPMLLRKALGFEHRYVAEQR